MGRGADEPIGAGANRAPEQIQREIEETQARLSDTLDAIQHKLAPRRIMNQVVDMYKHSSSDSASGIADTIRNNPIPIALVGLGLGWLMWSGTSHPQMDARLRKARYWAERRGTEARSRAGEYGETLRDRASDWTERASDAVQSVRDRVSGSREDQDSRQVYGASYGGSYTGSSTDTGYGTGGTHRRTADYGDQGSHYGEQARHYTEQARQRARQGYDSFWHMVDEHPLMAGLVGLVVGAAVGASIPSSRYENEMVGDYSDELFERTRSYGANMIERATQVARSAAEAGVEAASDAGRDEAQRQGLTPEQMRQEAERNTSTSDSANR